MSLHTLNDGVTSDPDITSDSYDEWWKDLAPPLVLIGDYYKRGLSWKKFQAAYLQFLVREPQKSKVLELIELARHQVVTILCVEDTPENCHRHLLAEECLRLCPDLEVVIV